MTAPFSKEIAKLKKEIFDEFEDELLEIKATGDGGGGAIGGGTQDDRLDDFIDKIMDLFLEKVYSGDLLLKGSFICDKITTNQLIINRGTGLESDFGDVEIKGIAQSGIDLTGTYLSGITVANSSLINSTIDACVITNTMLGTGVVLGSEYSFLTKAFLKGVYMWDTGLGGNNYLQTNVRLTSMVRPSLTYDVIKATNQLSIGGNINLHDEEDYVTFENVNKDGATFTNHINIKTNSDEGNYLYFPDTSGHYRMPPKDNVLDSFYETDISGVSTIVLEDTIQQLSNKIISSSTLADIPNISCDQYDISGILSLTSNRIDKGFIDTSMNFGIAQTLPKKQLDVDGDFIMGHQSQQFDISYNDASGNLFFSSDYSDKIDTINIYNGTINQFNNTSHYPFFIYDENDISLNIVGNGESNNTLTIPVHPQDTNENLKWRLYDNSMNLLQNGVFNILDNNNNIEGLTGIRHSAPEVTLDISGTDAIRIPSGTIAERPNIGDKEGLMRFNTEIGKYEGYANGTWGSLGGLEDIDQDTFITASNANNDDLDQLRFVTNNKLRFFIDNSDNSGYIGIDTENPEVILDISNNGAIRIPRGTTQERPNITDNHGLLRYNVEIGRFEGFSDGKWRSLGRIEDVDRDTYIITTSDTSDDNDKIRFFTNNEPRLIIDNEAGNGNIGIGTETPQYELDISGTLNATRIIGELDTNLGPSNNGYTSDTTNTDISMNISSQTKTSDAISNLDFWLFDYFVSHPPAVTDISGTETTTKININWNNPNQIHLAFVNDDVPKITNVKVDISGNNSPQWVNIMDTSNKSINGIELFLAGEGTWGNSQTNTSGTTYQNQGTISKEVVYDFRIYCINDSDRTINYNYIYGLKTVGIGVPSVPLGLQSTGQTATSISIGFTDPADTDISNLLSTTIPPLEKFKIDYTTNGLVQNSAGLSRYGGEITHTDSVTHNNTGNSNESKNLTGLNPGHNYTIKVAARNTQNSNYGVYTTDITASTIFGTSIYDYLSNNFSIVNNGNSGVSDYSGYSLDGLTLYNDIIRLTNIQGGFGLNLSSYIRTNNTSCSEEAIISTFYAYGGQHATYLQNEISLDAGGFGITSNDTTSNTLFSLEISNDGDQYTPSSVNGGYWKACKIKLAAIDIATNYTSGYNKYSFSLKQSVIGDTDYNSNTVSFYIEDFETKPVISDLGIIDVTTGSTNIDYISGVPMYTSGTVFRYQMNITNLCNNYLRQDKRHATISIFNGNNTLGTEITITQGDINGTTHFYYDTATNQYETSQTLHNTNGTLLQQSAGQIQFNTFTITLNSLGNLMYEDIQIRGQPWAISNVFTNSNSANITGGSMSTTDGSSLGFIRSDEKSKRVKDNWNTGSNGQWYFTGSSVLPNINTITTYDHTTDLSHSDYNGDLHLLNGVIGWPRTTDYNTFYWPTGVNIRDYSGIGNNGLNGLVDTSNKYRYSTFKFTNALTSAKGLYIDINGASGFNTFNLLNVSGILDEEIELFIKIEGGTAGGSTRDTGWLNANKNGVSINENNYDVDGTGTIVGSIDSYSTNNTRKVCVLWSPSSGNVWVKLGIKKDSGKTFTNITVNEISSS